MERWKGSRVIPRHAAEATTVASFRTWRSSRHSAAQSPEPSPDPSTRRRSDEAGGRPNGVAWGSKAKRGLLSASNQEHSTLKIRPAAGRRGGWRGVFLSGFARIFGYLGAAGGLRGSTVTRPRAPLHGLADGLRGWLRLLAGWGCWLGSSRCFFFEFKKF